MAQRSVKVRLIAEIGQYLSSMRKAKDAAKDAADEADKSSEKAARGMGKLTQVARDQEQAWDTVSTGMLAVGTAGVVAAGMAVKTFADFDKAMSSVQAATHASTDEMELLREAAVTAGAETAYSAEEAAAGIEELAKAGVATEDILNGGLSGALSLAAAGGLEVGEAAEIAASALTQFKLEGKDVEHVADLLAAGAGKAQGSVQDLGGALEQVGLVAAQSDLTIEETVGGLAAFASAGLTGSDAGTSFKTMLQRLNPQSEAAATLMEELGLSAYDSQGNFVGLSEYAGQLKEALSGMSTEQRNATMNTLFGSDAVRAAAVLYEQGAEGVQKWEDAVSDAGYAAETAALMQDNLMGDLEKLGGALDTVFLQAGSGANDALRGAVQGLEGVVDAVGRIPGPVLTATTAIAGVGGAGLIAVGGVMKGVSAVADFKDGLDKIAPASGRARTALGKLGKVAGVAGAIGGVSFALAKMAEANYMDDIDDGMGRVALALSKVEQDAPGASDALDELFQDRDGGNLIEGVADLGSAIDRTFDKGAGQKFNDWAEGIIHGITGIEGSSQILEGSWERIDQQMSDLVSGGNAEAAAENFDYLAERMMEQGASMEEVRELFPGYVDALAAAEAESGGAAAGADAVTAGMEGLAAESEEAALSLEDVIEAMSTLGMIQLDAQGATGAFHDAMRGTVDVLNEINAAAADPEIADMGRILNDTATAFDVTTEAGYAAQGAFADVAAKGWDMVEASAAAGASLEDTTGDLWGTYDGLVATAQQFGFGAEQAHALAREAMGIPDDVNIDTWMSDAAKRVAESTSGAVDGVDDHVGVTTSMDTNARAEAERLAAAQDAIDREIEITTIQKQVWDDSSLGKAGLVDVRSPTQPGVPFIPPRAKGGRVPAYASGGRLPATGLGTDSILGVSSMTGQPTAWVDDREWVVNRRSSDKYDSLLGAVNRDDPRVRHLAGFASGGRPGREFTASASFHYSSQGVGPVTVDASGIESAVARGLAGARVEFKVDHRTIYGIITDANKAAQRR